MEQDKNKKSNPFGGIRQAGRAVSDFLRAGRRNEAKQAPAGNGESAIDLDSRIRQMSDEEFDNAIKTGELTPEQIRKAGEYGWDVYMGDVWSETDWPEKVPEPWASVP